MARLVRHHGKLKPEVPTQGVNKIPAAWKKTQVPQQLWRPGELQVRVGSRQLQRRDLVSEAMGATLNWHLAHTGCRPEEHTDPRLCSNGSSCRAL